MENNTDDSKVLVELFQRGQSVTIDDIPESYKGKFGMFFLGSNMCLYHENGKAQVSFRNYIKWLDSLAVRKRFQG